jgi:hypothetical protein
LGHEAGGGSRKYKIIMILKFLAGSIFLGWIDDGFRLVLEKQSGILYFGN